MARPDGVVIAGPRFWALARLDGSLTEGELPQLPVPVARIPLVRGIARLGLALAPLFGSRGAARWRERLVLVLALAASAALAFVPHATLAGATVTVLLVVWLFRGRTRRLHGAEHRAIAAAEEQVLVGAWQGTVRPTRFAARCGTNFAAIAVAVTVLLAWALPFAPAAVIPLVSTALSMEIWSAVQRSRLPALRALLWPGLALQRLTTGEPSLADTRVALRAAESVLARELG